MEAIHILFGCDEPGFEEAIKTLLRTKGYDAKIHKRYSKLSIKEFIAKNEKCNTVIIKESFGMKNSYMAEEVAQLTDLRDVNVIIVLNEKHRGTDYMSTLYSAGIVNAIFQTGRKGGASVKEVATLILKKRTRKAAREYYGIASNKIELGFLDYKTFEELYKGLQREDSQSLLESYIDACSKISPQNIADFTRRLPKEDFETLVQFEEFHTIVQLLKKFGVDLKVKRPKKVVIGLNKPVGISLKDENIVVHKFDSDISGDAGNIKKDAVNVEPKDMQGVSLSQLFGAKVETQKCDEQCESVDKMKESEEKLVNAKVGSLAEFFKCKETEPVAVQKEETLKELFSSPENTVVDENMEKKIQTEEDILHTDISQMTNGKFVDEINEVELAVEEENTKEAHEEESAELEEESQDADIVFEEYDEAYEDLSMDAGQSRFSLPYLAVICFFVIVVAILFVTSGSSVILF